MENNNAFPSKTDRKTIERNRRNQMKSLYSKLNSLIPRQSSKEVVSSLPDQLEHAANYIKKLQINLERMKQKKQRLKGNYCANNNNNNNYQEKPDSARMRSPKIQIHEIGSALEIVLVTGLDFQFMFNQTIRVLHEEGAEVINASFSVVADTIFHSIHSQVGDSNSSLAAARISERLEKFVRDCNSF